MGDLANEGIINAIGAAKLAKTRLANLLSRYDEFYFGIEESTIEDVASLVAYLQLYAVDDNPVAMIDMENGKPQGLTIFISQKQLGTANHALIKHRLAEFAISSNAAVFKTARKAKICANCVYGHKEPHCPIAGEVTMYHTCEHWELWKV